MSERNAYTLEELIAQCDPGSPMPPELLEWQQAEPVGLEQSVMEGQVDIQEAVLAFGEKLSDQYKVAQLILFGSRARGDYQSDSDADVAVMLRDEPGDFVETKLAMTGVAFDVLLQTDVRIQLFPIWETEWHKPEAYSNPTILLNIARESIIIWQS
ncbi:nucleotidyltransferase domain-containing protein [Marinobacter sp. TBZ242]|uniref:Nucleotidyltransferase domain-containing protein n=1 Tax=Marinobacter azerbaijanicus TaxID=3050455 RepID=A0ABT7IDT2_9GAMM|nr:nucleotidyltransferase domain-containing protein [Marinobacter sp. TBZ242]MDL0432322.1 nucleotidyltransferase domain-containing protein [Marinobacter sp. TBZ242]